MIVERPDEGTTALIYARVSTDDKGQTNETQVRICREFCERQGIRVLDVYTDEVSGSTLDRPGFSRMVNRIIFREDAFFVVAYDQSRITRGEDFETIKNMFWDHKCRIRLASMDIDLYSYAGKVTTSLGTCSNSEQLKVNHERTRIGMNTRRINGFHIGRPAAVMFEEDLPNAPKGRFSADRTKVITEDYLYSFARRGCSIRYVALQILSVSDTSLKREMRPCTWDATCDPPKVRPDRLTPYRAIFDGVRNGAEDATKGSSNERVGKTDETSDERVVS